MSNEYIPFGQLRTTGKYPTFCDRSHILAVLACLHDTLQLFVWDHYQSHTCACAWAHTNQET